MLFSEDVKNKALDAGSKVNVETGYERIDRIRSTTGDCEDRFLALSTWGNYEIAGTVVYAWQDRVVLVRARDITLMVEVPPGCENDASHGTRVAFGLYGLTLWDVHL